MRIEEIRWPAVVLIAAAVMLGVTMVPAPAFAYIGPGAGVSLFGAAIGVIVAIFTAIGVVLFWPIRMLIRMIKGKPAKAASAQNQPGNEGRAA
jgi:uncharacterized membrane protein